jgi:hypothetical protein
MKRFVGLRKAIVLGATKAEPTAFQDNSETRREAVDRVAHFMIV